ncbi:MULTISPECIES: hypothetical protein [unclassified Streptomyces]|uniref:hypothetical protein n=1 Tax=unclassified Streptomyces TaxID=2593676 RepID=UPI002E185677|nr:MULTISPECIES: hypothetical protein [unclassified Streptomyces]
MDIVYGSDLLGPMHSHQLDEFTLRAQVQPAADLIRSATAARLLREEGRIGVHADLLVLDGNRLEDISVLTKPREHLRHVIKAGTPM